MQTLGCSGQALGGIFRLSNAERTRVKVSAGSGWSREHPQESLEHTLQNERWRRRAAGGHGRYGK